MFKDYAMEKLLLLIFDCWRKSYTQFSRLRRLTVHKFFKLYKFNPISDHPTKKAQSTIENGAILGRRYFLDLELKVQFQSDHLAGSKNQWLNDIQELFDSDSGRLKL